MLKAIEVEEISEAIKMLEKFDQNLPSICDLNLYIEGLEFLNEYLENYPKSPHEDFINNKKIAHTKRLLQSLPLIDTSELNNWLNVMHALGEAKQELEKIYISFPELKSVHQTFINEWRNTPELERWIKDLLNVNK